MLSGVSEVKVVGFRVVHSLTRASVEDEYVCVVGCKDVVWLCGVPEVLGCIDVSEVIWVSR